MKRIGFARSVDWKDRRVLATAALATLIVVDRIGAWLTGTEAWLAGALGGGAMLVYAFGHCDSLDGPVVTLARRALEAGNVNLVLPWVREQDEAEIREAFADALAVRKLGPPAKAVAERHFFETLVRVHRSGEGAPYTGLKPAGRDLGPAIPAADRALRDGSIDKLTALLSDAIRKGLHERFARAAARQRFDPDDVKAGRSYVEAYVGYIHYVEHLWQAAGRSAAEHPAEGADVEHAH